MQWVTEAIARLREHELLIKVCIAGLEKLFGAPGEGVPVTASEVVAARKPREERAKSDKPKPAPKLKKSARTIYTVSQTHIVTALEAAGESLSTHALRECLLTVNIRPSEELLKKVLKLAQERGVIALGDDGKWHVTPGGEA